MKKLHPDIDIPTNQGGFNPMKTALITGASRGIGEATAYQLAKEFDCVAIVSRNTDGKLNTVANQIHTTTNCECIPFT